MGRHGRITILVALVAILGAWGIVGAQSGAPVPGWVQTPGGGWVPPDHPLAAGNVPPVDPGPAACSARTVEGTYAIHMQGTRPVPPGLGGGTETVIGVVIRTYDGVGSFTQVDNVKGSVTGLIPDREGFGTYQVTADCFGSTQFQPGPGILIEERMAIVEAGRELRSITATPAALMVTSVQQRIDRR